MTVAEKEKKKRREGKCRNRKRLVRGISVPLNVIARRSLTQIRSLCTGYMSFVLEVEGCFYPWKRHGCSHFSSFPENDAGAIPFPWIGSCLQFSYFPALRMGQLSTAFPFPFVWFFFLTSLKKKLCPVFLSPARDLQRWSLYRKLLLCVTASRVLPWGRRDLRADWLAPHDPRAAQTFKRIGCRTRPPTPHSPHVTRLCWCLSPATPAPRLPCHQWAFPRCLSRTRFYLRSRSARHGFPGKLPSGLGLWAGAGSWRSRGAAGACGCVWKRFFFVKRNGFRRISRNLLASARKWNPNLFPSPAKIKQNKTKKRSCVLLIICKSVEIIPLPLR